MGTGDTECTDQISALSSCLEYFFSLHRIKGRRVRSERRDQRATFLDSGVFPFIKKVGGRKAVLKVALRWPHSPTEIFPFFFSFVCTPPFLATPPSLSCGQLSFASSPDEWCRGQLSAGPTRLCYSTKQQCTPTARGESDETPSEDFSSG